MLPKPSLVLQAKLMPEDYSEATAAEIKRSYMYIAQSVVSELPEGERADGNVMRLSVRLMKPHWNPADEGAEELWNDSFMPWLANATRNMSTAMHNFNTVMHPVGARNVRYQWADYDFVPNAIIRVKMDDENRITAEAPALIDKVRTLMAEGVIAEDAALIRMPSKASLQAQEAAFEEELRQFRAAQAAAEAAQAASEESAAPAEPAVEAETAPEAIDAAAADETAPEPFDAAEPELDEAVLAPEEPAAPAPAEPVFALDYSIWGIEYADGTVVEFDSRTV